MSKYSENVVKYYVFKNDVRLMDSGFVQLGDAISYALENNVD